MSNQVEAIEDIQDRVGKLADKVVHGFKTMFSHGGDNYASLKSNQLATHSEVLGLHDALARIEGETQMARAKYEQLVANMNASLNAIVSAVNNLSQKTDEGWKNQTENLQSFANAVHELDAAVRRYADRGSGTSETLRNHLNSLEHSAAKRNDLLIEAISEKYQTLDIVQRSHIAWVKQVVLLQIFILVAMAVMAFKIF